MKIHYLQHVCFEDLANIEVYAREKGHSISKTLLYENEELPDVLDFDWLIIMGGPMGVYDEYKYPWLVSEKFFVKRAISEGKIVLGICLGAQLLADVLGAKVYKNKYKEIGWLPITLTNEGQKSDLFSNFPKEFVSFQWHGDTFNIPDKSIHLAKSEVCENQAFVYNERVIGIQFHLESSFESVHKLIDNCGDELVEDKYIQGKDEIISNQSHLKNINELMYIMLENIEKIIGI